MVTRISSVELPKLVTDYVERLIRRKERKIEKLEWCLHELESLGDEVILRLPPSPANDEMKERWKVKRDSITKSLAYLK